MRKSRRGRKFWEYIYVSGEEYQVVGNFKHPRACMLGREGWAWHPAAGQRSTRPASICSLLLPRKHVKYIIMSSNDHWPITNYRCPWGSGQIRLPRTIGHWHKLLNDDHCQKNLLHLTIDYYKVVVGKNIKNFETSK